MKLTLLNLRGGLLAVFLALCMGVGGVMLSVVNSTEVKAEACIRQGEAKVIGGLMTCDCTVETFNTCGCVVPCPPPKND